jgi:hypothetical protein
MQLDGCHTGMHLSCRQEDRRLLHTCCLKSLLMTSCWQTRSAYASVAAEFVLRPTTSSSLSSLRPSRATPTACSNWPSLQHLHSTMSHARLSLVHHMQKYQGLLLGLLFQAGKQASVWVAGP